jgi:hypothetical protein
MKNRLCFILILIFVRSVSGAQALPSSPADQDHPGSKIYQYSFKEKSLNCAGRSATLFLPVSKNIFEKFAVVVFGHGQALDIENYRATMEHLAKKGVAAVFPIYDTGFFDQDWVRMGRDYVTLTDCAVRGSAGQLDLNGIIFSGHSKGAYVASIAAGLAVKEGLSIQPRSLVLVEMAGFDSDLSQLIEPSTAVTVVYSDKDTTVSKNISDSFYAKVKSSHKQYILFSSYSHTNPKLNADHMWPLSKGSWFGGGSEGPFHYYGLWKWLVAAAVDIKNGGLFSNKYIYGPEAGEKGLPGIADQILKNF